MYKYAIERDVNMESRINEEKVLEHFKNIINDLTYADWMILEKKLNLAYNGELKDSTYTLKVDTNTYSNIKNIYDIF